MHILIANVHFRPFSYGGATHVAEAVATELARRGHRLSVIAAMPGAARDAYRITRATAFPGVESYLISLPPRRATGLATDNPAVTAALAPLIARLAPDLAHIHCVQEVGAGIVPLLKSHGIPVILSFHDYWWICARQFLFRSDHSACTMNPVDARACAPCAGAGAGPRAAHLGAIARSADIRTAPSHTAAQICADSGTGPVTIWQNGIRPPGPGFAAARAGRSGPVVFGYLGGPSALKGWPLLRAASRCLTDSAYRGLLVDAGVFAPWWRPEMLKGLADTWIVHPRFAPEDIDDFYGRIDALIFPSQWHETYGLAVREALARGLRVIRTDAGGQAEHPPAPGVLTLPIGASPEALTCLMAEVIAEIDAGAPRQLAPGVCHSISDQTDAFLALAVPLMDHRSDAA